MCLEETLHLKVFGFFGHFNPYYRLMGKKMIEIWGFVCSVAINRYSTFPPLYDKLLCIVAEYDFSAQLHQSWLQK